MIGNRLHMYSRHISRRDGWEPNVSQLLCTISCLFWIKFVCPLACKCQCATLRLRTRGMTWQNASPSQGILVLFCWLRGVISALDWSSLRYLEVGPICENDPPLAQGSVEDLLITIRDPIFEFGPNFLIFQHDQMLRQNDLLKRNIAIGRGNNA